MYHVIEKKKKKKKKKKKSKFCGNMIIGTVVQRDVSLASSWKCQW